MPSLKAHFHISYADVCVSYDDEDYDDEQTLLPHRPLYEKLAQGSQELSQNRG